MLYEEREYYWNEKLQIKRHCGENKTGIMQHALKHG